MKERVFELFDIGASFGERCELLIDALEALEHCRVVAVAEKLADLG